MAGQQSWDQESNEINDIDLLLGDRTPPPLVRFDTGLPANATKIHDTVWYEEKIAINIGGRVPRRTWKVSSPISSDFMEDGLHHKRQIIDYFYCMFPMQFLPFVVSMTNEKLQEQNQNKVTEGEVLKFFGVLILVTRFEFGRKQDLWKTASRNAYMPAPCFGEKTGMSRDKFLALLSAIRFSKPPSSDQNCSSIRRRWGLVQDFVDAFNKHRIQKVNPRK